MQVGLFLKKQTNPQPPTPYPYKALGSLKFSLKQSKNTHALFLHFNEIHFFFFFLQAWLVYKLLMKVRETCY